MKSILQNLTDITRKLAASRVASTYDQEILLVNVMLCELLLQPKKATQDNLDKLLLGYRNTWARLGSTAKKWTEVEQLEIMTSSLGYSTAKDVVKLTRGLTDVKDALEKMLQ